MVQADGFKAMDIPAAGINGQTWSPELKKVHEYLAIFPSFLTFSADCCSRSLMFLAIVDRVHSILHAECRARLWRENLVITTGPWYALTVNLET